MSIGLVTCSFRRSRLRRFGIRNGRGLAALLAGIVAAAVVVGHVRQPQVWISDRVIEVKNFFGTERFDRASVDGLVVGGAPWSNEAPPALWLVIGDRHVYVSAFRGVVKADRERLAEVMLTLFADRCDGPGHIGLRDMEVFLDRFVNDRSTGVLTFLKPSSSAKSTVASAVGIVALAYLARRDHRRNGGR